MRRIVMFIFLLISLVAIVAFSITIEALLTALGITFADIAGIVSLPFNEMIGEIGVLMSAFFNIYGVPLIVFLVSFNGLTQASKRDVK